MEVLVRHGTTSDLFIDGLGFLDGFAEAIVDDCVQNGVGLSDLGDEGTYYFLGGDLAGFDLSGEA
mgnify:CR=1 FL=1